MLIKIKRLIASIWGRTWALRESRRRLREYTPRHILVVCYGNIYRSPFVEHVLKAQLGHFSGVVVRSSGFHDKVDRSVQQEYSSSARKYGVDLDAHRSRITTRNDLAWADCIIIMDSHNYRSVWNLDSTSISKIIWLGACSDDTPVEIRDPYGMDIRQQKEILKLLNRASLAFCARINFNS